MRVKAAVARHHGAPLAIEPLDLDEPRDGEILVRLIAAGVAACDHEAIAGRLGMPLPFVPGTEAAGIVERVGGGVTSPGAGDAVLIAYASCGSCPRCAAGDTRRCEAFAALNLSGRRLDGSAPFAADGESVNGFFFGQSAFATHLVCRAAHAITLASDAPLELLAPLCGDFLTGAAPILGLSDVAGDDAIVISGAGTAGLAACMVAKARGIGMIIVADPNERRRQLALEIGATIAVPADEGFSAVVKSLQADGVRFALEASGTDSGTRACLASLAPGGICALARVPSAQGTRESDDVRCRPAEADIVAADLVPKLIALYKKGELPIEKLINFFPFDLVNDALAAAASGAVAKPVLRFSLGAFGDLDRAETEGAAIDQPGSEPKSEPKSEPTSEPTSEPSVADPDGAPATQPIREPVSSG